MKRDEFVGLLNMILRRVFIVPDNLIIPYKKKALKMVRDIDINDVIFVACTLAYPKAVLWSDDERLKKIKGVRVINTKEMMKLT